MVAIITKMKMEKMMIEKLKMEKMMMGGQGEWRIL